MTTSTADPAPAPPAADGPPLRIPSILRATAVVATAGVVVALIGLGLMFRPVTTPTQDCGTALGFLLEGRVNEFVSETDPPAGITAADAKANNADPCRQRVADAVKPGAVLFAAGLVAALGALAVEVAVRTIGWWKRRQAPRTLEVPHDPPAPIAPQTES